MWLLIYGTRQIRKRLGRVADYCPRCQTVRQFRVTEIREVGHFYLVRVTRGRAIGHLIECESCRTPREGSVLEYRTIDNTHKGQLDALIERTNPGILDTAIRELELAERAANGDVSPEERLSLLRRPFWAVSPAFEKRASGLHLDLLSAFWLLCMLAVPPLFFSLWGAIYPSVLLCVVAVVVLLFMLMDSMYWDPVCHLQRRHGRFIAESLGELNATPDEIEQVLDFLKRQNLPLGQRLKLNHVLAMLEKHQPL
jgi:hypothetical protein